VSSVNDGITQIVDSDLSENTIIENVEIGSYAGITLDATDGDGAAISYEIQGDVPFTVDEEGRIVTDADVDFEQNESFTFDVVATSTDGSTGTQVFSIDVSDLQEVNDIQGTWRSESLNGTEGTDYIEGQGGNDTINAGAGDDTVYGGDGNDTIRGGAGDDIIFGDEGNDDYYFSPFEGNDEFHGGDGWTDTIHIDATADPNADPDNPWTISVDGEQLEYDLAAGALELDPDTSGIVTLSDGSELNFSGVDSIEW